MRLFERANPDGQQLANLNVYAIAMKRILWAAFVFFLWLPGISSASSGQAAEPEREPGVSLAMDVFLRKPANRVYEIHVHLTNHNPEPVTVNLRDLPWLPPNDAGWLSAFRMDARNTPLQQDSFPGKFGSQGIRLVPGESVQGKLVLNQRMPTLLEDVRLFGVRLEWECDHPSLHLVCRGDTSRSIVIPQDDPGEPDVYAIDEPACRQLEDAIGLIDIPQGHEVLFLRTMESVMTDRAQTQALLYQVDDYVRACQPTWTNSWAVDFFAEERVAGFLREQEGRRYFEKGLWQQANIGQYSSQIRTLYRFPWSRKKADTIYLSVYRDPAGSR
ncbi:MAG: hypothetical protein F4090_00530 [Nitrospira sp. SB0672_bin_25]|nr:hypothetical protein [Nitrospira sp. SB0666_bin_27]MYF24460.1 hypothetical protein [Nitrospira sp. SB0678_bin_10]MYJ53404.1 hypothetical protein [Nitrospira sp. SB0672_bin_25]